VNKNVDDSIAAYPQLVVADGKSSTSEQLPAAFYENFPAVFIGRRGNVTDGVWPEHSSNRAAVECYKQAQTSLHTNKDAVAAIRAYERALDHDPMYLQAWVGIGIACIADNTPESLDRAEGVFIRLCAIEPGEWLGREVSSILHQNLAYISVHRYRQTGIMALLEKADAAYAQADGLAETVRIEMLCPWTFVKWEKGERASAENIWHRVLATNPDATVLKEYVAKYAPLKVLQEKQK
jgi:tetratricopeptide (TPR) repeat protein